MPVQFILGRAGTGKTRACLDAVLAELAAGEDGPQLVLLVPEQASFQMERALATRAPRGGYTRAAVLSFSRLASRVFELTGGPPEMLLPRTRRLLLGQLVRERADSLSVLRPAAHVRGLYDELDRVIDALLREAVSPEQLRAAAEQVADGRSRRKVEEIAELYGAYVVRLGPQRIDAAARLALLRARLAGTDWLRGAHVWVDGFAGFTGQEFETLVALAEIAARMHVALLLDPDSPAVRDPLVAADPLSLFSKPERTYQHLVARLAASGMTVLPPRVLEMPGPRFAAAPAIARLESGLSRRLGVSDGPAPDAGADLPSAEAVRVLECPTQRAELTAAARWVRATVANSGGRLRFRDFAVIARDLTPLVELVEEIFADFEIPCFVDRRRPLRSHPLCRLAAALLDAAVSDCETGAMVRLLRTRLLPIPRDASERLENLAVQHVIRGAALWRCENWPLSDTTETPACRDERRRLLAGLDALLELASGGPATGAAFADAMRTALERLGVADTLQAWIDEARQAHRWEAAELHRLAWEALCGALEDVHAALGAASLPLSDWAATLTGALADATVGLAPPTLDQVLVSSIERSRHPDIRHAWLIGFNAGLFPALPGDDRLLGTEEREALVAAGLPALAPRREEAVTERLLAYIALTRPSESLTISFAQSTADGEHLEPSPLLADVLALLPGVQVQRLDDAPPPTSLRELAASILDTRRDPRQAALARRCDALVDSLRAAGRELAPLDRLLRGLRYTNTVPPLGFVGHGPVAWRGSPSQIETFIQCPFKHLAQYRLRLDAWRRPRPLRWDLGAEAHDVLAAVTRRVINAGGDTRALSDEAWLGHLAAVLAERRAAEPAGLRTRRPELAAARESLEGFLREVVKVQAERLRRGSFTPWLVEHAFDSAVEGGLPDLALTLADGRRAALRGRIDRVDVCVSPDSPGEALAMLYDYKSSAGGPAHSEYLLDARLQLVAYLLAIEGALWQGRRVRGVGVLQAPLYPDTERLRANYVVESEPGEQLLHLYRPRGLLHADHARLLDPSLDVGPSAVAPFKLNKDRSFAKNAGDVLSNADWVETLDLARATLTQAAEGLAAGRAEVAPLATGSPRSRTLACQNCEFARVCRFDRAYNVPRAAELHLPTRSNRTPAAHAPPPGGTQ